MRDRLLNLVVAWCLRFLWGWYNTVLFAFGGSLAVILGLGLVLLFLGLGRLWVWFGGFRFW